MRKEVMTPEKVAEQAKQIADALGSYDDDRQDAWKLAYAIGLDEGASFDEALEAASKYIEGLSDDDVAELVEKSEGEEEE